MLVTGHYDDGYGEVLMLADIVVMVVKGERILELGSVSRGTRGHPP